MIHYVSQTPETHLVAALLQDSNLKRPVHEHERIRRMMEASNVVHAAYLGDRLVGLLRGWTDGVCEGLICDLAVHPDVVREGVAMELILMATSGYPEVRWWYPQATLPKGDLTKFGWKAHGDCWELEAEA